MTIPVAAPKALLADKGYDGDRFRESLLIRGILPIIPPRSNRKVPSIPTIAATGTAIASSGLVTVLRRSPISLGHLGFEGERAYAAQI